MSDGETQSQNTGVFGGSPSKGPFGLLGGGGIQQIIANAGIAAQKSGLTMDSKGKAKLDRGQTATGEKSQRSGGTKKTGATGTMSRKSKAEEDFENMEIEEVEILIENAEREMKLAADAKRKI